MYRFVSLRALSLSTLDFWRCYTQSGNLRLRALFVFVNFFCCVITLKVECTSEHEEDAYSLLWRKSSGGSDAVAADLNGIFDNTYHISCSLNLSFLVDTRVSFFYYYYIVWLKHNICVDNCPIWLILSSAEVLARIIFLPRCTIYICTYTYMRVFVRTCMVPFFRNKVSLSLIHSTVVERMSFRCARSQVRGSRYVSCTSRQTAHPREPSSMYQLVKY